MFEPPWQEVRRWDNWFFNFGHTNRVWHAATTPIAAHHQCHCYQFSGKATWPRPLQRKCSASDSNASDADTANSGHHHNNKPMDIHAGANVVQQQPRLAGATEECANCTVCSESIRILAVHVTIFLEKPVFPQKCSNLLRCRTTIAWESSPRKRLYIILEFQVGLQFPWVRYKLEQWFYIVIFNWACGFCSGVRCYWSGGSQ